MSAEVTDADRELAHRIWNDALCNSEVPGWKRDDLLAQALADQRAAADDGLRARVEALAGQYAANGRARELAGKPAWPSNVARDLRAALDPPTATPCPARHDVHEDGVTATWSCQQLGAHGTHKDSQGRRWTQ